MEIIPPAARLALAAVATITIFSVHVAVFVGAARKGEWEGWPLGALLVLAFGFCLAAVLWGKRPLLRAARVLAIAALGVCAVMVFVPWLIGWLTDFEDPLFLSITGVGYAFFWAIFLAAVRERQARKATAADAHRAETGDEPGDAAESSR